MPTNIQTLKKIVYQDINQFLEDINKNFAVVENSPLYKGIVGKEGEEGDIGLPGVRGIKFIFVNLQKFQNQFPNEIATTSQIDVNYINTKLLTFNNKQKLLLALEITELIDKDIIVLSNTIMLSYNFVTNKLINTGIAFNEQSNILNNIQQQIEDYVQYYVNNNQTINNLSNTFESYITYAKNYSDTNNTFITSSLIPSSVYSPYIPGFNSNIGILMNDHKYFGYSDSNFPQNNNGTIVFGSMKKYYNILINTLSTNTNNSLSSDYAPGVNNIPVAVFLQDTENAGILIGYKEKQNLKRFASIYKNNINELIIKSDSGINPSEFSLLKISKDYLKFDKKVQFGNDLEVSRDASFFADINNLFLKTGKFTEEANLSNEFNKNIVEVGKQGFNNNLEETIVKNIADKEMYKYYIDNILITDINGVVSKNYSLEKQTLLNSNISNLNLINLDSNGQEIINSSNKILSSFYFAYLARKINAVSNFCDNNYWKKNQFNTGEISDLWLVNNLRIDGNTRLSGVLKTNTINSLIELNSYNLEVNSANILFQNFHNKVLVTQEGDGKLLNNYYVEKNTFLQNELNPGEFLSYLGESEYGFITTKYYGHLARKINSVYNDLFGNYWNKLQFETFEIPNLYLSNTLQVKGDVIFGKDNNIVFYVNSTNGNVYIGSPTTTIELLSSNIVLSNFINKVLVTDINGKILNTFEIETQNFFGIDLIEDSPITLTIIPNNNKFVNSRHINFLARKINSIINWIKDKYWSKIEFTTNIIPSLKLNDFLSVDKKIIVGDNNNPNLFAENDNSSIGKTGGNTIIKGTNIFVENKISKVLVTDNNSKISDNFYVETDLPNSGPGTGGQLESEIKADFWIKEPLGNIIFPWQPFLNIISNPFGFITAKHFEHLIKQFKVVRELIFDRPTYQETIDMIGKGMPIGSIILYDKKLNPILPANYLDNGIPIGWVVCDGRIIPGTSIRTNNMTNKFVKGSLTPSIIGGNVNHLQKLIQTDLAPHSHTIQPHTHGVHPHAGIGNSVTSEPWEGVNQASSQTAPSATLQTDLFPFSNSNQTSFSVEPHSITAIYILKYWNGIGTAPVTVMPAFSNISLITNNKLNIIVEFSLVDSTVNNINIEGTIDNGITWNTLSVYSNNLSPKLLTLPYSNDWKFRLKAIDGDSSFTVGEYSNILTKNIYTEFAEIINITNNLLQVIIDFNKFDATVTDIKIFVSEDNGLTYIEYVSTISGINQLTINVNNYGIKKFKLLANNGIPSTTSNIIDNNSNIFDYDVSSIIIPVEFVTINNVNIREELIDDIANGGGGQISNGFYIDFSSSNLINPDTTLINIEYLNTNNIWTTIESNVVYSTYLTFGYSLSQTTSYRFKAVNGSMLGSYSNQIMSN